jgi:uncharacterized protein YdeI (YjbR/CyaY-like superfamily)
MAAVVPHKDRIRSFRDSREFEDWLRAHHDREPELWIRIHKKDSGLASITALEALDVVLCYGWIDGLRKAFDEKSFLQRYTPRRPRSIWSQVNRDKVARLIESGRMTAHGQRQIDIAKTDGRWDAAYRPIRETTSDTLPRDLRNAIQANPRARRMLGRLSRQNLFALEFRTNNMKTPEGRARKISALVAMLARGETIVPQQQPQKNKKKAKKKARKKAKQ